MCPRKFFVARSARNFDAHYENASTRWQLILISVEAAVSAATRRIRRRDACHHRLVTTGPIICAFGDSLRTVFGEAGPPRLTPLDISRRIERQRCLDDVSHTPF